MNDLPYQNRHVGVYGICIINDHVLLVRKVRGPYTGQWDTPGGGIEFGEEPEAALRREFIEETGIVLSGISLRRAASHLARYVTDSGASEELHHLGFIYDVTAQGSENSDSGGGMALPEINLFPDGEDSGGALWVPLVTINPNTLTPFARLALSINTDNR